MSAINDFLSTVDNLVWGVPLMVLILAGGLLLTVRLGLLQVRKLPLALWMIKNEEEAEGARGEITSFAALCTALSATIGTGNIVGVATAVGAGGPGALFWMIVAAFFGMATKYSEGLLAVKYSRRPVLLHRKRYGCKMEMACKAVRIFRCVCRFIRNWNIQPGKRHCQCCQWIF